MKHNLYGIYIRYLTVVFLLSSGSHICYADAIAAQSGKKDIKGVVIDTNGEPLPGATVQIKGKTAGVITDMDGNFSNLTVTDGDILVIKYIGMTTKEVPVDGKTEITIVLEDSSVALGEVTVVAFGQQKTASVIASIESVKMSDLKVPAANLTSAFAGKIPGVISYQTSGEPGADNAQFFVRGVTTFGYKSEPLILIDGFEATSDDLARIQPDDVESFSILKDASATALYGARGANGIILVSTKAGHEGKPKINARVDTHVATPTQSAEFIDGVEYMRLYNSARMSRYPMMGAYYSEQKIQSTLTGENPMIYPNVDWYDALFNRHTINTKANINISGGGQVATYYVAGGYDNETGLLKVDNRNNFNNNVDIDRFHVRTNVIFKLSETTTLDTRINGRFERYSGPYESANSIFRMIMDANPVDFPAFYEPDAANKYTEHTLFGNAFVGTSLKSNPYAEMVKGYENRNENTFSAQATLAQNLDFLTKGLKFQVKASANVWSKYSQKRKYSPYFYNIETYNQITGEYKLFNLNPTGASAYLSNTVESGRDANGHYYFEARLNWDRQFGSHSVGFMTVGMAEEKLISGGSTIYETLPERNMGNSGRLTYDYDLRYFFEFAYGYNGSEKFTGAKKYGFFPSFGAGWLVSNESFWLPLKNTVSNLKLKFTYGRVGNDAIGALKDRFHFLSDISLSGGEFTWGESFRNTYPGYQFNRYANPDINWEVSTKYNLGLELGFFKNEALKFQIDFFRDIRSRIYWPRENFPSTAGLEATLSGNVGKASSQGIDASLDYQRFFNKDFWLTGRANFTYATSKVLEKDEKDYTDEYLKQVGHSISQQWGLVAERLFVDDEEIRYSPHQDFETYMAGDIKYTDINGDGVVNSNDRIPMGYPTVPEIQYGFGLSSGYRKIDFSFFFQGNARVSFFIDAKETRNEGGWKYGIAPFANRRNALAIIARDSWTEDNPDVHAFWPRLSTDPLKNNTQQSSWWLRNGSFLRLKTVELGYSLPGIEKVSVQNCRIYASVENAFVTSPFKLWDPEMGSNGLGYPLNRRFNVGIQLSF